MLRPSAGLLPLMVVQVPPLPVWTPDMHLRLRLHLLHLHLWILWTIGRTCPGL
jgi:hypothetical protein